MFYVFLIRDIFMIFLFYSEARVQVFYMEKEETEKAAWHCHLQYLICMGFLIVWSKISAIPLFKVFFLCLLYGNVTILFKVGL